MLTTMFRDRALGTQPEPPELTPGEREAERLRQRARFKQEIERGDELRRQIEAVAGELRGCESESSDAVELHRAATEPLQAQLLQLDLSAEDRAGIRQRIDDANRELQATQESIRKRANSLRDTMQKLFSEGRGLALESRLTCTDVADARLHGEWFAARQRRLAADGRVSRAKAALARIQSAGLPYLNDGNDCDWQAELDAAQAEVADAEIASCEAYQRLIEE